MTRDPERASESGGSSGVRIEALLSTQHDLFERLDALGQKQSGLIADDQAEALLELLAERQRLIDGIAEVSAMLEPMRSRWPSVMESLPEAERERVRRKLDAMAGLTARIAQRDEADRLSLELRRDAVASELAQVHKGRGALAAYGGGRPAGGAKFQDREA